MESLFDFNGTSDPLNIPPFLVQGGIKREPSVPFLVQGGIKREPSVPFLVQGGIKREPSVPFYSSLLFYTNCVAALLKGKIEYAFSLFFLTFTSLLVHGIFDCKAIILLDKFAILQMVSMGGYYFYQNLGQLSFPYIIITVSTFLTVIAMYYYGYLINQWCFDPNKEHSEFCHAILHCFSSLGHHLIIGAL